MYVEFMRLCEGLQEMLWATVNAGYVPGFDDMSDEEKCDSLDEMAEKYMDKVVELAAAEGCENVWLDGYGSVQIEGLDMDELAELLGKAEYALDEEGRIDSDE